MAVMSGARRGALRSGRYATFSITKLSSEQTTIAATNEISSSSQPGQPVSFRPVTTVQLVRAPTISTSPCAKLIRLMIP